MAFTSPLPRWQASFVELTGSSELVLFGGHTNANSNPPGYLNDVWLWKNGNQWQTSNTGPPARAEHAAAFDGTNMIMTCGVNETTWFGDTWNFSPGTSWTNYNIQESIVSYPNVNIAGGNLSAFQSPYVAPNNLRQSAMAYQSGQSKAYLFGGVCQFQRHYSMDFWSWSHATASWTQILNTNCPPARSNHAMASSSSQMLLFGGQSFSGFMSDSWLYSGSTNFWTNLANLGANYTPGYSCPTARYGHSIIWDSGQSLFVLFGGIDANGYCNDTWTFNPSLLSWNNVSSSNKSNRPPPRAYHAMAYNSAFSNSVMFSGLGPANALLDTWTFNSSSNTWLQIDSSFNAL